MTKWLSTLDAFGATNLESGFFFQVCSGVDSETKYTMWFDGMQDGSVCVFDLRSSALSHKLEYFGGQAVVSVIPKPGVHLPFLSHL